MLFSFEYLQFKFGANAQGKALCICPINSVLQCISGADIVCVANAVGTPFASDIVCYGVVHRTDSKHGVLLSTFINTGVNFGVLVDWDINKRDSRAVTQFCIIHPINVILSHQPIGSHANRRVCTNIVMHIDRTCVLFGSSSGILIGAANLKGYRNVIINSGPDKL